MFASKDTLLTRPSGGYNIARSVRTRSSASGYFSRTPASASNRKTWTWSGWVKRGSMGTFSTLFSSTNGTNGESTKTYIAIDASDLLTVGYGSAAFFTTTQVFRDPSAWYHIVVAFDSTQATATNRVKVYVNGTQVTAYSVGASVTLNVDSAVNFTYSHSISALTTPTLFFDGYLTEINFIDGQALTPSSFGETDSITGVWKAKKYGGTYGTNGFYLNFSDNSSNTATTIGKDYSGNGNNWTPNNISVTAGATYDSMVDSPTVGATSSNYAVLNPTWSGTTSSIGGTWSNGNLKYTNTSINQIALSSFALPSSGKYYWEVTLTTISGGYPNSNPKFGICDNQYYASGLGAWYVRADGLKYNQSSTSSACFGSAFADGNVVGFAVDMDNQTITFYKNNTAGSAGFSSILSGAVGNILYPFVSGSQAGDVFDANFGQRPFSYTPPTGFVALNTYNLPASTIKNGAAYMAATLYTGNLTGQSITNTINGASFQPDLVWIKSRSAATDHKWTDSVRGATKALISNTTAAETTDLTGVTAINSNGFTVGASTVYNNSAVTYVAWQWLAGASAGSSNTNGTITSTVSAGATQGFSVVTYTGTGANATVGHGLGVAPQMIIVKSREVAGVSWNVYHISLGNTKSIYLNLTNAPDTNAGFWNNTSPTSSVFSVGTIGDTNQSTKNFVAYCFAPVAGYSAFGSYTGNGSTDGPFVYTGFRPSFFLTKRTDSTSDWIITDDKRDTYNVPQNELYADLSNAESTATRADFLSNGFKVRGSGAANNASGGTYIYMAFAEVGFKSALAR